MLHRHPAPLDTWQFSTAHPSDVASVRRFIRACFHSAYGADVCHFLPALLALRRGNALMAACGVRRASAAQLFLETYLDMPVEQALAERTGVPADRRGIVEVGNLSIAKPGASRLLIAHLTDYLHARGIAWTVFTAVPALRNNFLRLGIPLHVLADAEISRIPADERDAWGRYYEQRPIVCAVSVRDAWAALGS
jgi:hypothetical protein